MSFANNMDERKNVLDYWRKYRENKSMAKWMEGYEDLFSHIDKKTFPSLFDPKQIFKNYCENAGHTPLPGEHPSKESHQLWADYLMDKIR